MNVPQPLLFSGLPLTVREGWMLKNGLRAILGPLLLLFISYIVYFLRYPIWNIRLLEPIFALLILSYFVVFVAALLLLRKDMGTSLHEFFRFRGLRWVAIGVGFAVLFQVLWIVFSLGLGGTVQVSFAGLSVYTGYGVYFFAAAFGLYCVFAVFGAFVEEVAYRGYVQTRISQAFGVLAGVLVSALFFSLQHIHIFQFSWLENFFQEQFIYVLLFGVFAAYFFLKRKQDIWAVFSFHGLMNIFNIALPIESSTPYYYTDWLRTILCFSLLILILKLLTYNRRSK